MMDFTESLSIVLPNVQESYKRFQESTSSGLIIEIAAIHEGLTANFNNYSSKELEASIESWVQPYPRPIILNHDSMEDPLGRVMAAKMGKEDGLACIMLQTAINKPEAIERYMDNRYLTGSVGGKVEHATCSICQADWATASMFSAAPCEHERGKLYKGKLASLEMKGINWKEYSMVNTPADAHSGVRGIKPSDGDTPDSESDEGWVRAHMFSVDMNKESVVEFTESGDKDLLAGVKRKIALPLYHNMRGSFLSVLAISEEDHEENDTVSENTNEEKEDILGIAESLSDDLADNQGDDGTETPVEDAEGSEDSADEEVEEAPVADEETTDVADEDLTSDEEVDSNADEENTDEEVVASDEEDNTEEPVSDESEEEVVDEDKDESDAESAEAGAELANAQERITALEAEIAELSEENLKLRSVLKKGLAERVVDRKIDLGYEDIDTRSTLIEEHVNRSAGSLADSLRDLMKVRPMPVTLEAADGINFTPASGSKIVKGDKRVTTIPFAEESKDEPTDPSEKFIDVLSEGLMGHRAL